MNTRLARLLVSALAVAMAACSSGIGGGPSSSSAASDRPSPIPSSTAVTNIYDVPNFAPLEVGEYSIDPDKDAATPLRVLYSIPAEGWAQWIGAFKLEEGEHRAVGVSIANVSNLVADGCSDHGPADPPVGPEVDDLASALVDLAPFQVKDPPTDVTLAGYSGKHLSLLLPDVAHEFRAGNVYYTGCTNGEIWSWKAPNISDAFYGYQGPGAVEEFWILDVEGSRLVIIGGWYVGSPASDVAEMHAILDSIRIEP